MAVAFVQDNYTTLNTMYDPDDPSYDGPYELTMTGVGAGNCLVAFLGVHSADPHSFALTVTDDNSDTWTSSEAYYMTSGGGAGSGAAYLVSATGGTTVIDFEVQLTGDTRISGGAVAIYCAEFSGVGSVAYDKGRVAGGSSANEIWGTSDPGTDSSAQDVLNGDMIVVQVVADDDFRSAELTTGVTDVTPIFTTPFNSTSSTTSASGWKVGYKSFSSDQLAQNITYTPSGFVRRADNGLHLVAALESGLLKYIPNISY